MRKIRIPAVSPYGSAARALSLLILLFGGALCQASDGHSPYLDMHRKDPVQWRHWGPEVLAEAERLNRPIFISVGYFSCYWCHVMQQESFLNADIAALLNRHFIPVIVDRELNPALDAQLLAFVERYRGAAGWPLNTVLTPRGYPLLGAVYLPRDNLHKLLTTLATQWPQQHREMRALARQAAQTSQPEAAPSQPDNGRAASLFCGRLLSSAMALADELNGGFGETAKFPLSPLLDALMHIAAIEPDSELADFLQLTLDHMAAGNLRDHLRGGFFRYTTDPGWQQPHFEKMLYDNAQLAQIYFRAAALFARPDYDRIGFEILDFLSGHMRSPKGAYYAALSAIDLEGRDGGYYLWQEQELRAALGDEDYEYAVNAWPLPMASDAGHGLLPPALPDDASPRLRKIRQRLLAARPAALLPVDRKIIAGWNGLALAALASGAARPGGDRYKSRAAGLRNFLLQQLYDNGKLYRVRPTEGKAVPGTLADYAWVAAGLLAYDRLTGKPDKLALHAMLDRAQGLFYDEHGWRASSAMLLPLPRAEFHLPSRHLPSASASLIRTGLALARQHKDRNSERHWRQLALQARQDLLADPLEYADYIDLPDTPKACAQ